jgi:hypothetical protein
MSARLSRFFAENTNVKDLVKVRRNLRKITVEITCILHAFLETVEKIPRKKHFLNEKTTFRITFDKPITLICLMKE